MNHKIFFRLGSTLCRPHAIVSTWITIMLCSVVSPSLATEITDWKIGKQKEEEGSEFYTFEPKTSGEGKDFIPVYLLSKPKGEGPFPAIILNHGGNGSGINVRDKHGVKLTKYGGFVTIACNLTHAMKDVLTKEEFQVKKYETWKGPGTSEANIRRDRMAIEILNGLDYVDNAKLGMWGYSGGGHLTLGFLTTANQKNAIKAATIFSAGIHPWWEVQRPFNTEFYIRTMSPSREDTKNINVALLHIHGRLDTTCISECAEALEKTMTECGNNAYQLVWLEDEGHGTTGAPGVWTKTIRFFRTSLGLPDIPLDEAKIDPRRSANEGNGSNSGAKKKSKSKKETPETNQ